MSDILRPGGDDELATTPVPHSGNLGLEQPVEDFDNTTLEAAATRGLLTTPEDPSSLTEQADVLATPLGQVAEAKKSRSKLRLLVGGGAVALLVGAGLLVTRDGGDASTQPTEPAEETTPGDSTAEPTDSVAVPTDSEPVANIDVLGETVRVADALKPGEEFITATRANGEEIRVPRLRDTSDLNAFGESALALMACYLSTGSQECLDEFSTNEEVQDTLARYRQDVVVAPYQEYTDMPSYGNFQMAIYDEPSAPAEFTWSEDEPGFIVSSGGPIYFQFSDADAWQGLNPSQGWYGQVTEQLPDGQPLEFRTAVQPDGSTDIIGMRFHLDLR